MISKFTEKKLLNLRLWSYYADGHRGVVFEIDFSGLEERNGFKIIHKVTYDDKLPWSSTKTILGRLSPREVLSRKTEHWWFEAECRIIDESKYLLEEKYFDVKDRIKAIYLGTRTKDTYPNEVILLKKIVPSGIPIYTTKLNEQKIIVEPDKLIKR
jgi:hypothetical protein